MEVAIPKPIYFDRFLGGKIAAYFIENTRRSYGYVCQPTRKRYFSVPHRSYMSTIDPVKKIDGISFVIFVIDDFSKPIEPDKPKRPGYISRNTRSIIRMVYVCFMYEKELNLSNELSDTFR